MDAISPQSAAGYRRTIRRTMPRSERRRAFRQLRAAGRVWWATEFPAQLERTAAAAARAAAGYRDMAAAVASVGRAALPVSACLSWPRLPA